MQMNNELCVADLLDVAALAADGVQVLHLAVELSISPPQFAACVDALRRIHTHAHHTHAHTFDMSVKWRIHTHAHHTHTHTFDMSVKWHTQ